MPHEILIIRTPSRLTTFVGISLCVMLPCPSWPLPLAPHVKTSPFDVSPAVCLAPHTNWVHCGLLSSMPDVSSNVASRRECLFLDDERRTKYHFLDDNCKYETREHLYYSLCLAQPETVVTISSPNVNDHKLFCNCLVCKVWRFMISTRSSSSMRTEINLNDNSRRSIHTFYKTELLLKV